MKVIRGEWKSWLNIQKTKIMSSSLITSWQIDGKTMTDLVFLGSKITADGDCSHGIKRCLLLGRKAMTNLDSILKSRDITLLTTGLSSSQVWMWELDHEESWALQNWCFWTVVLEKTLEITLDCKETNQSVQKEISSAYSLEGLKLKLQYFGHLTRRTDLLEMTLMLERLKRLEEKRTTEKEMAGWHHWLDGHEFE